MLKIGTMTLSSSPDRWVWSMQGMGEYMVGSVREYIDKLLLPMIEVKRRWNCLLPIKINVFVWRLMIDRLPCRLNLSRRGMDINSVVCVT